jgi:Uncharacterized membrane-anchored protein conserved in bacteria
MYIMGALLVVSVVFSIVLALVFAGWYASEKTVSTIHSNYTRRREAWYWLTILFTFALGTTAGDLTAEKLDVGYWKSGLLFAALIAVITAIHYALKAHVSASHARHTSNAVLAFWLAYILTRSGRARACRTASTLICGTPTDGPRLPRRGLSPLACRRADGCTVPPTGPADVRAQGGRHVRDRGRDRWVRRVSQGTALVDGAGCSQ